VLALLVLCCISAAASAGPRRNTSPYDPLIDAVVARYHLPGIAVGVIEHGKLVYTRAVGELAIGSGKKIDADTLFKIASNSKAMTSTVLARLVQQAKLRWNDPVVKYLPNFAMYDPWVTQHMQVGDLLVHHSGLPEGGGDLMLWPEPNDFTRADIIHGLRYIKPAYDFRAGYAYDNLLYVVAGEVAARAGGAPYEQLVRREIFTPLHMTRCQVGEWNRGEVGNVAQPHARASDHYVVTDADGATIHPSTMEAAGGIRCSLHDMLTWAMNWLAPTPAQLQWLVPAQRQTEWTPYTPMPISKQRREWDGTRFLAYGYGWRIADVDGELTVSHTGTLSGMYSALTLLPDRQSGFVILINAEADDARTVLNEVLLKTFTAPQRARTVASLADELQHEENTRHASRVPDTSSRKPATSRELASQLGVWRDAWFGEVSICAQDDGVHFAALKSPTLEGPVMHVGDRYLVQWTHGDAEAWLSFPDRSGGTLRMAKVDPDADFSYDYEDLAFTRIGNCASADASTVATSPASTAAETGLVDVRTLAPNIGEDITYAGSDNFVGRPVAGYLAPKCLLLKPAAEALARVERDVEKEHMRLQAFDCYRPVRAVQDFVRWAHDLSDQRTKAQHYPEIDKSKLLGDYIASTSGHSRGATVDLTLMQCDARDENCKPLDMGTDFDYFGQFAHTDSARATPAQHANRMRLKAAMERKGFKNYPLEWWHYTLTPEPAPTVQYDVPVQ
jgi:CubicO group peptidase (beta-lactamase class C family)/D-alanyl-D-alanine dipeptidase